MKDKDDNKMNKPHLQHWQKVALILGAYDVISIAFSYFLALWLRFDCKFSAIPRGYMNNCLKFMPIYIIICLVVYYRCRLYRSIWRFAGYNELIRCFIAVGTTFIVNCVGITVLFGTMPMSYYLFGAVFQMAATVGIRFSYRMVLLERKKLKTPDTYKKAMLIGAGAAGQTILKELNRNEESNMRIVCIIDDNPNKKGRFIDNVPVVGDRDEILYNVKKYGIDEILFAIPSASAETKRDILNICNEANCNMKALPSIPQIVNGKVSFGKMKPVAIEDLLGRETIKADMNEIFQFLSGKVILVTGGGGSIGSELSRQIAKHNPKQLIIFDIYENNAYDIEQELRRSYPKLNLVVLIGSVRDSRRVESVFAQYRPDIVYHAAAHKHVPLMENSPCEAIKNNVVGTYKTACAAVKYGTKRFVLISTDKAVNPTNIMGASKRMCEMVIQCIDKINRSHEEKLLPNLNDHDGRENVFESVINENISTRTEFAAVRFGNVLGSNGSVIPLFKKQIEEGGPVTVTHPDIIRYFMTIPEAVSLVLQAGTYAKGGEIFVLDMGAPMKIDTLARNLIRMSGYTPDKDIKVVYTGLRPGEKLFEEKLMSEEGMKKTSNKLIHIGSPIPFEEKNFLKQLETLAYASYDNVDDIVERVETIVTTFHPSGAHPEVDEKKLEELREKKAEQEAAAGKRKMA